MDKIYCLNLADQHNQIKAEVFEAFEKVYEKTAFSGGPFVQEFEDKFAKFCDTDYAVGVNTGTTALHLAMLAMGIGPGDEVIVPANTFIATVWGVSYTGATPVFVDCDPDTWEIDAAKVEEKINSNTKLIIGVHLYGQPFDVEAIKSISERTGVPFIEDAAQAHGATYNGQVVGGFGEMACYSFYPGKNLGACGEGGGITTNNKTYVEKLHSLRNHGCKERYYHDELGYNYRMGGLEGASLGVKINYLPSWNESRQKIAARYYSEVKNPKIKMQKQLENVESVFHLFVVTVEDKEGFVKFLDDNGIVAAYHYPVPCHLQKAYADLGHKVGDFPNSEYLASHCVTLPMYAELDENQIDHIISVLNNY